MHPEDIEKTKKLIQQTSLLSSVEKAEWLQLLSEMNDKQILDLISILTPRPKAQPVSKPLPLKVDIHQREIGTSVPFYEAQIPAHTSSPHVPNLGAQKTPADLPSKKTVPAPADPTDLQNRVENIVKELEYKKKEYSLPPMHDPLNTPLYSQPVAPEPAPKPVMKPVPVQHQLDLKTPADFVNVSPEDIRGESPDTALQGLLSKMAEIGKKTRIYEIIDNLEKSPIYKAYIDIGVDLLNDPNPDRNAAYEILIGKRKKSGQAWLTKEEFEAFTDFRKRLDQMV
jgi:hypothetical protein